MSSNNNNRWFRSQPAETKTSEEELFVFGYSCKIFRDEEKATFIDQGKHLIPWMGDENLMIDRYDVRGYLHDLTPYEPKLGQAEEQSEEERLCDEERYLALRTDLTEEELYHEEELKRLRAALASDGAYHEISFSYDSIEDSHVEDQQNPVKDEPEDEPYSPPAGLNVPKGMHVPSIMKIHAIIERTAVFVSQQGGQMEIIIKMKQSDNPQFAFMHLDNPLYPYYRHVMQEVKSGRYKPVVVKKEVQETDDDHHHDGHYLHPSLSGAAGSIPKFTVPTINFQRTGDDSYSLLVKNLKQTIEYDAQRNSPTLQAETVPESDTERQENGNSVAATNNEKSVSSESREASASESDISSSSESEDSDPDTIIPPPPDIKPIIDKMAEYVAKNGEDFETIVKSRNDKRFAFLERGHKFYNYYMFQRNTLLSQAAPESKESASTDCRPSTVEESAPANNMENSPEQKDNVNSPPSSAPELVATTHQENSIVNENSVNSNESSIPSESNESGMTAKMKTTVDTTKAKPHTKVIKGPICFSLKSKETDPSYLEKTKLTSLLLDDSEDEDEKAGDLDASSNAERKARALTIQSSLMSVHPEPKEKPKKLTAEEMETKLAEERIKGKLATAARERIAQHKKDKQLQFERKQKAALFLKMLQKKKTAEVPSGQKVQVTTENKTSGFDSPVTSMKNSPRNLLGSPQICSSSSVQPGQETVGQWSSSSSSSSSDSETAANDQDDDEEDGMNDDILPQVSSSQDFLKKKLKQSKSRKSKSHKHSRSKKHKRPRSRSPSGRRHKSSKLESRKEKKLPAAYALVRRSRSRSRSPPRYQYPRPRSPLYFNRWR